LGATLFFWIEGNNERWWGEKEIVASLFIFFHFNMEVRREMWERRRRGRFNREMRRWN
jgi:hypothetical protein